MKPRARTSSLLQWRAEGGDRQFASFGGSLWRSTRSAAHRLYSRAFDGGVQRVHESILHYCCQCEQGDVRASQAGVHAGAGREEQRRSVSDARAGQRQTDRASVDEAIEDRRLAMPRLDPQQVHMHLLHPDLSASINLRKCRERSERPAALCRANS